MWREEIKDYWDWFDFVVRRCLEEKLWLDKLVSGERWRVRQDMVFAVRQMKREREDEFYKRQFEDGAEVLEAVRKSQWDIDAEAELSVGEASRSALAKVQSLGLIDNRGQLRRKLEFLRNKLRELNYGEFVFLTESEVLKEVAKRVERGGEIAEGRPKISDESDLEARALKLRKLKEKRQLLLEEHPEQEDDIEDLVLAEKVKILE